MAYSNEIRSKYLSVIVPVYNEEESIPHLHERIHQVLATQDFFYEIIYVDDGSKDKTFTQLNRIAANDSHVQAIRLRRNFGQTAAIAAGVAYSSGEILVFMDGDLQNDPIDIPRLLAKIEEGYDVVSGWRKDRQDAQLSRKIPSRLANKLISKVTGVHLHDYGCTLKAYRYEVFQHVRLYGEMHRFLPAYAALAGASITELPVTHHARLFGKSKYGISRTSRVILDLLVVKFLGSYGTRPLHAFGLLGLSSLSLGVATGTYSIVQKIMDPRERRMSLFPVSLLFSGFGLLSIMSGLLAELLMRTYYESQRKPTYVVKQALVLQESASMQNTAPSKINPSTRTKNNGKLENIASS